jgi:hypothetical protein
MSKPIFKLDNEGFVINFELLDDLVFDIDAFCSSERETIRQIDPRVVMRNKTKRENIT